MIFPKLHITLERWRWNKTHQLYVSTLGNFMTKDKQVAKVYTSENGYLTVKSRGTEKKFVQAHRLVMKTWKPIDNADKMTVDHLNHNKRDNSLQNLEWVTKEENTARATADHMVTATIKESTIQRFLLLIDNKEFSDMEVAWLYVKSRMEYLDAILLRQESIEKIFKTLTNAYVHKNQFYIDNGFVKEKYNCKFSIVEKGE